MLIKRRSRCSVTYRQAIEAGLSPLLARVIAGRLTSFYGDLSRIIKPSLKYIDRPELLRDGERAAERIASAIVAGQRIGILTDYDVDGVTSHAVIYHALTRYFDVPAARIDSLIGHRMQDGYGISPGLTERILTQESRPAVIMTADCGSSDEAQITRLQGAGIDVIVTDHHALPLAGLPRSAHAVINPTRADCDYPDSTIAGCMVAWLLMSYVRSKLIAWAHVPADTPKLARELDYVALGTVADCVSIGTAINRAVVTTGLHCMNRLQRPCWRVMQSLLGRNGQAFTAEDLAFQIGPRINARSRLADPYAALKFLLAPTEQEAHHYLTMLDLNNQDRKLIERDMVEAAKAEAHAQIRTGKCSLVIHLQEGHPGVQGIVASRLVQTFGRPAVVFCDMPGLPQLTGSARSIPGLDILGQLQRVADICPNVLVKFGGHKAAAGMAIYSARLAVFQETFEGLVKRQLDGRPLSPVIWTDGILEAAAISLTTWEELESLQPYGREFEAPMFEGVFQVATVRAVGAEPLHLALTLNNGSAVYKAIWFRALAAVGEPWPITAGDSVHCVYRLARNEYRGVGSLQLIIEHISTEGASMDNAGEIGYGARNGADSWR